MKIKHGIIIWVMLAIMSVSSVYADKLSVLIIESYHPVLAWTSQCEQGITEELAKDYVISTFYMDTKRIPEKEFALKADKAWKRYMESKPDLVMLGDDNALKLLGPRFAETKTPVVYFGINDNPRRYFHTIPENITGVLERTPVVPWLRHLKRIVPWADKALILMDQSVTSEAIRDLVFQGSKQINVGGIVVEYKLVSSIEEWKNSVNNAKKMDFILMPTFHALKNEKGKAVSMEEVIVWTSANSQAPVFTNQDYTVWDKGVIGAYVIYGKNHGKLAAEMARDILQNRKSPGRTMPKTERDGVFYFNSKQLQRFKIELPADIRAISIFK